MGQLTTNETGKQKNIAGYDYIGSLEQLDLYLITVTEDMTDISELRLYLAVDKAIIDKADLHKKLYDYGMNDISIFDGDMSYKNPIQGVWKVSAKSPMGFKVTEGNGIDGLAFTFISPYDGEPININLMADCAWNMDIIKGDEDEDEDPIISIGSYEFEPLMYLAYKVLDSLSEEYIAYIRDIMGKNVPYKQFRQHCRSIKPKYAEE